MKQLLTIIKGKDLTGRIVEILLPVLISIFHNECVEFSHYIWHQIYQLCFVK